MKNVFGHLLALVATACLCDWIYGYKKNKCNEDNAEELFQKIRKKIRYQLKYSIAIGITLRVLVLLVSYFFK